MLVIQKYLFLFSIILIIFELITINSSSMSVERKIYDSVYNETINHTKKFDKNKELKIYEPDGRSDMNTNVNNINEIDANCYLHQLKHSVQWWIQKDGNLSLQALKIGKYGALDLSHKFLQTDMEIYRILNALIFKFSSQIVSLAYNLLHEVPFYTIMRLRKSLKYLSLSGNNFTDIFCNDINDDTKIFPDLPKLLELDISNCQISTVHDNIFRNMPNLRKIYMSHNRLFKLDDNIFQYNNRLIYIDLSYMNYNSYRSALSTKIDPQFLGFDIGNSTFSHLSNLTILDFSHTILSFTSIQELSNLPYNLRILSLCYCKLSALYKNSFKNTQLKVLDLAGNSMLTNDQLYYAFSGIKDTIQYVSLAECNFHSLKLYNSYPELRVLNLTRNNIRQLHPDIFEKLPNLITLDLSCNSVGNWYEQRITNDTKLKLLDLRANSINIFTRAMVQDLILLDFVALGDNNFVCTCQLTEVLREAAYNVYDTLCTEMTPQKFPDKHTSPTNSTNLIHNVLLQQHDSLMIYTLQYVHNLLIRNNICNKLADDYEKPQSKELGNIKLLDYTTHSYWCYNNTKRLHFEEYQCKDAFKGFIKVKPNNDIRELIITISIVLCVVLFGIGIYTQRWYIRYYYNAFKSAALVSSTAKESTDRFNKLIEEHSHELYDLFISYCKHDRVWLMDELLPELEQIENISVCLHERDFQIGVTILDNIVSCMDRSRVLMLIISQHSLLSQWCQFEMHLAQHRIFENNREHLILILLDDLPRIKRPKTLQYLMNITTYIKWPKSSNQEERKRFWKRLKKSLHLIGLIKTNNLLN